MNPSEVAIHPLAWRFVKAYRTWFIAPDVARDKARTALFKSVTAWAKEGCPLLEGESRGSIPLHLSERAGLELVEKSAEKKAEKP